MLTIRHSSAEDAKSLAPRLRDEDVVELAKLKMTPWGALHDGFRDSLRCYTLLHNGLPWAMYGVSVLTAGVGIVWLLSAPLSRRLSIEILREAPRWVNAFQNDFPTLLNAVWEGNQTHIKWLKALGFTLGPSHNGFHHFTRETSLCVQ